VTFAAKPLLCARVLGFALVAQLDRASDFESEGREFESLRARQENQRLTAKLAINGCGHSYQLATTITLASRARKIGIEV
jgi:hypothetical protein